MSVVVSTRFRTVAVVIALSLCALAWIRLGWSLRSNPPAARYLTFVTDAGVIPAPELSWTGPAFARGDIVWRAASYNTREAWTEVPFARATIGMVRVDFRRARAEMLWRLPGEGQTPAAVFAFAAHPSGDAAVIVQRETFDGVGAYRLSARGGVRPLGPPLVMTPSQILGVAWVGEQLEIATRNTRAPSAVTVFTSGATDWTRADLAGPNCDESDRCRPQVAYREGGAWVIVRARAPGTPWRDQDPAAPTTLRQRADVLLTRQTDAGAEQTMDTVQLTESEYNNDFLSCAPGNVVRNALGEVYELAEGRVRLVEPPRGVHAPWATRARDESLYVIAGEGLTWLPAWRSSERVMRTPAGWLFARQGHGLELRHERSGTGTVVVASRWPETWWQFIAVPAEGAGAWLLDAHGGYARMDASLRRIDAPGVFARLGLLAERFQRFRRYVGFERRWKLAALPMALFLAPLALGIALLVARRRRGNASIALVCSVVTVAVGPWFWWLSALL